jgi:hypothetical protein
MLLSVTAALTAAHAQHLPATPPTSLPAANSLPAPIAATPSPAEPRQAEVTYAAGLLNVRADNSSLNQILREIAHLTGMTIIGGVTDERVFGNYGPSTPGTILATLLDGTGSNMLYRVSTTPGIPSELVLTPRNGGPTPPSPTSAVYNPQPQQPRMLPLLGPGNHPPIPQPSNNSTTTTPVNTTTSTNPNGVATPEQIFQRLRAMQQARQAQTQHNQTPQTTAGTQ